MGVIDRRIAELARSQYDVASLDQLRAIGVDRDHVRRRVRDGLLYRLFRGVYAVGSPVVTQRGWWKAATLAIAPDGLLSHTHGSALWDLVRARGPIDVLVPGQARRRQPGLRIHRTRSLHPDDRTEIDDIPVTSLARTLLDCAETVTERELQRAYERAEELQILDVRAIEELLARSNGRRGVAALAALLEYDPSAAARAESELSRLFLDLVRSAGISEPQTTVLVDGFLVDAFWPEADLVVELDGYEFHCDREAFERDRAKAACLRRRGRTLIAFTYRQVTRQRGWVIGTVRDLLAAAPPSAGASS